MLTKSFIRLTRSFCNNIKASASSKIVEITSSGKRSFELQGLLSRLNIEENDIPSVPKIKTNVST